MKILLYEHALYTAVVTDFCGTSSRNRICTKDTELEVLRILKNPYLPDRRDVIILIGAVS